MALVAGVKHLSTEEALRVLAKQAPIVELAAGNGHWAAALRRRGVLELVDESLVLMARRFAIPLGELLFRADWQYEAEVRIGENLPDSVTRQVSTINASVGANLDNGMEVLLWARNLNEDEYYTSGFPTTLQAGSFSFYPNQPRTYGVTLRSRF